MYYARKKLSYTRENDVINKLTDKLGQQKRLEAEKTVKWVLERRKNILDNYCKVLDRVQNKIKISIEKIESLSLTTDLQDKFIVLAGESKHVSTQEPYFYESSYKVISSEEIVPVDDEGQAKIFT